MFIARKGNSASCADSREYRKGLYFLLLSRRDTLHVNFFMNEFRKYFIDNGPRRRERRDPRLSLLAETLPQMGSTSPRLYSGVSESRPRRPLYIHLAVLVTLHDFAESNGVYGR